MTTKLVITTDGEPPTEVELTVEEEQQRVLDAEKAATKEVVRAANRVRLSGIANDADLIDLLNRLKTANATQIKTYMTDNVTDLASARAVLTKMALLLALLARST